MGRIPRMRSKGFTLVELLVVVTLIIVLAGFIMTAVWAAQESGRLAHCKNNLRQLHGLIMNYTQDYGGYLPSFWHERWVGELALVGPAWGSLPDDLHPQVPVCWANQQSGSRLMYINEERPLMRSGAPFLLCESDLTGYRCDQGCLISYMGLAKYGWWHRGNTAASSSYFIYVQLQEVENPGRNMLLGETEPGSWQFGSCGCRWHVYSHPDWIVERHYGGGNVLHFDGNVELAQGEEERQISYYDPDYKEIDPGW